MIARSHSEDMAARDYFGHNRVPKVLVRRTEGAGKATTAARIGGSHYTTGLGENIYGHRCTDAFTKVEGRIVSYTLWLTPEGLAQRKQ